MITMAICVDSDVWMDSVVRDCTDGCLGGAVDELVRMSALNSWADLSYCSTPTWSPYNHTLYQNNH